MKLRLLLLVLIAGLIATLAGTALILWLREPQEYVSPLPPASEVESIVAHRFPYSPDQLRSRNLPPADQPADRVLPDFPVPQEHIEKILSTLRPARAINFKKEGFTPWMGLGEFTVKSKGGRSVQVHVYHPREDEPGAFGVFGVDPEDKIWGKYRGGSSSRTWEAVLDAYVEFKSREKPRQ